MGILSIGEVDDERQREGFLLFGTFKAHIRFDLVHFKYIKTKHSIWQI